MLRGLGQLSRVFGDPCSTLSPLTVPFKAEASRGTEGRQRGTYRGDGVARGLHPGQCRLGEHRQPQVGVVSVDLFDVELGKKVDDLLETS